MRKVAALVVFLALAAGGLAACTPSAPQASESQSTVLRLGWSDAPPTSLDPAAMQEGQNIIFAQALYDSLLAITPQGELEPDIATKWSYNDDLTELRLTLREGVRFSDGEALDADAVVANIEHVKAGTSTGAQYAASIESATAEDANTVTLHLSRPDPSLTYSLAAYAGFLASPAAIKAGTLAEEPVGSGPYTLDRTRTQAGTVYTFSRNKDHWDAGSYAYDEVVVTTFDDAAAEFNAISAGQIDGMFGSTQKIAAAEQAGLTVNVGTPVEWRGLLLNDRKGKTVPALADVRVRQAINYAFDRKGILDALFGGQGTPTTQVFNPRGSAWVDELNDAYPYDPQKAKELLAEAGYADGFELPIATYPGLMDEVNPSVEQQLGDIGITVKWVVASPSSATVWKDMLGTPALVMSMGTYLSSWTDIVNVAAPTAMMNPQGIETPEFDAILDRIRSTSGEEQVAAYREASTYLVENAWFAPWLALNGVYFTSSQVGVTMQAGQIVPSLRNFKPAA